MERGRKPDCKRSMISQKPDRNRCKSHQKLRFLAVGSQDLEFLKRHNQTRVAPSKLNTTDSHHRMFPFFLSSSNRSGKSTETLSPSKLLAIGSSPNKK